MHVDHDPPPDARDWDRRLLDPRLDEDLTHNDVVPTAAVVVQDRVVTALQRLGVPRRDLVTSFELVAGVEPDDGRPLVHLCPMAPDEPIVAFGADSIGLHDAAGTPVHHAGDPASPAPVGVRLQAATYHVRFDGFDVVVEFTVTVDATLVAALAAGMWWALRD